ncbi:hypothetical protein BVG19_g4538 [[Candida] boidinii]|nr:hypothetical protein BVG19_g4538 [[Candida] boidinii]OWB53182.1 hypothetical protein B5S27_g4774 [[Candida] boidinii]
MNINTIDKDSMDTTNTPNTNSVGDTPKLVQPSTPLHPDADVEVTDSIDNEIPSNLANELDLDDDDDDDDDVVDNFKTAGSRSNPQNVITATENAFNSVKFDEDGDVIADVDNKINPYGNDGLEDADEDDDEINDDELEDITNGDALAPIKSIDPLQDMEYIDNRSLKGDEDENDELVSIDGDGGISETSIPNNSIFDPNNLLDIDLNTRLKNPPINPFGSNKKMISSNPIRIKRVSPQQQQHQNQQQLKTDSNNDNSNNINGTGFNRDRRLSLPQQGRLVDYLDTQLLEIQRKFIKHLSLKEDEKKNQSADSNSGTTPTPANQETNSTEFINISKLISSLYNVVNMIWFSIFQIKNVPCIYHNNLNVYSSVIDTTSGTDNNPRMNSHGEQIVELQLIDPKSLFGQTNYLIKIMGDFIDYLSKYDIENFDQIIDILKFLAAIDNIISILIDQEGEPDKDQEFKVEDVSESIDIQELRNKINNVKIVNNTEKIRMESIITRTKLLITNKFDEFKNKSISEFNLNLKNEIINNKRKLNSNIKDEENSTSNIDHQLKKGRNNLSHIFSEYEVLIGEVYEGIIDRTSI